MIMLPPFTTARICPLLLGRTAYLAALDNLIAQARDGHGQTVLITGEAGIGKSRLVVEMQVHAAQHRLALLQGRCFEPDRVLPYAPLLDLLRGWIATTPSDDVRIVLEPTASEVVRLLPELANIAP